MAPFGADWTAVLSKGPDDCCCVVAVVDGTFKFEVLWAPLLVAAAAVAPAARGAACCLRQKRPLEPVAVAVVEAALGLLAKAGDE